MSVVRVQVKRASTGVNVKAMQRLLGHASAAMTLDTHADLSTLT